jgi:hypothetical protein
MQPILRRDCVSRFSWPNWFCITKGYQPRACHNASRIRHDIDIRGLADAAPLSLLVLSIL